MVNGWFARVSSALLAANNKAFMTPTSTLSREFRFVPYGESFAEQNNNDDDIVRPTISCDGRIPAGVTLELTHWSDNQTPNNLYADTSTEMAIQLAKNMDDYSHLNNALVLNNHYDTDGVLSCWTCLVEPQVALKYEELLIEGAEAGDFGEWNSNEGVKLDMILGNILYQSATENEAYLHVFKELPKILDDLVETGGMAYQDLWKEDWDRLLQGWQDIQDGKVQMERGLHDESKLVLVQEPSRVSPYALHRGLVSNNLWQGTTRILRSKKNGLYEYEKIGHGWVQKLVQRHVVPSVDGNELTSRLNDEFSKKFGCEHGVWSTGGSSGLVAICRTTEPLQGVSPEEVAHALVDLDPGC